MKRKEDPTEIIRHLKHGPHGLLLVCQQEGKVWLARSGSDPRGWRKPANQTVPWSPARPPIDALLCPAADVESQANEIVKSLKRSMTKAQRTWRARLGQCDPSSNWLSDLNSAGRLRLLLRWLRSRNRSVPFPRVGQAEDGALLTQEAQRLFRQLVAPFWKLKRPRSCEFHLLLRRQAMLSDAIAKVRRLRWLQRWLGGFDQEGLEWLKRSGFKERSWALLSLWTRVPEGRELLADFPQLAWLLANSWLLKKSPVKRPLRSIRSLVKKPRNQMLRWLDLPAGDGVLRLLRRIECRDLTGKTCWRLKRVLNDPGKRRLLFALAQAVEGPIHPSALWILSLDAQVSLPMLRLVAAKAEVREPNRNNQRRFSVADIFGDCVRILTALNRPPALCAELGRIGSGRRLWDFHNHLVDELNRQEAENLIGQTPHHEEVSWTEPIPPPLPPAEWMTAIGTLDALRKEGLEMQHCVAAYAADIVARRIYVYAIQHPQFGRATLAIQLYGANSWDARQLAGAKNQMPEIELSRAVEEWLRSSQHPSKSRAFSESVMSMEEVPF